MITSARIFQTVNTNPHENLALEEAMLRSLPAGQAALFLWQNRHTVVVGAGQNAWRECRTDLLRAEGGTLARRTSGGGAVYHDLGNLNYSFVVPRADYDVARQSDVVLAAVRSLGIDAIRSGRNDLTAEGRKFSGNAFRLLKDAALQHGTLLIDSDMAKVARYLRVSEDKLKAKGVKSVPARVVNLSALADATVENMRLALIDAFRDAYGSCEAEEADGASFPDYGALVERNQSWDWNYGASPEGDARLSARFPWGGVELIFTVRKGQIERAAVFTDAMDETLRPRLEAALAGVPYRGDALAAAAAGIGEDDVANWLLGAV